MNHFREEIQGPKAYRGNLFYKEEDSTANRGVTPYQTYKGDYSNKNDKNELNIANN